MALALQTSSCWDEELGQTSKMLACPWTTNVCFHKNKLCSACEAEKLVGSQHSAKNIMTTTRPLELLLMDLFGLMASISIGGNKYDFVIVDD